MKTPSEVTNFSKAMSNIERDRAVFANKVYCKACDENCIKICSWENNPAWREFVDGRIDEDQLVKKAEEELKSFSETFKKYTVVREEDLSVSKQKDVERERAKIANKIYKRLCTEFALTPCFFKDFANWNDFVHGNISEGEFVAKAKEEAEKMAEEA
ncbi:MAG: hypothetical protein AB2L11_10240 [Syntrophobacteraceae bacterium]